MIVSVETAKLVEDITEPGVATVIVSEEFLGDIVKVSIAMLSRRIASPLISGGKRQLKGAVGALNDLSVVALRRYTQGV
jgi:hypothetical protein